MIDLKELQNFFEDNPFLDRSSDLIQIHSGAVMSTEVVKSLRGAEKVGMEQYLKVVDDVFINCNKSIMDVLHQNKKRNVKSKS